MKHKRFLNLDCARLLSTALAFACMSFGQAQTSATFQGLGPSFTAQCLSRNGQVVVGSTPEDAAYWTNGSIHGLGVGPEAVAYSCNQDGSIIVGQTADKNPFVWNSGGTWYRLPLLAGTASGKATLMSADGSVIAGYCDQTPTIWSLTGTFPIVHSTAGSQVLNSISDDGSTIVGEDPASYALYAPPWVVNFTQDVGRPQSSVVWTQQGDGSQTQETAVPSHQFYVFPGKRTPADIGPSYFFQSLFCTTSDGSHSFGSSFDLWAIVVEGADPQYGGLFAYWNNESDGMQTVAYDGSSTAQIGNLWNFEPHSCNWNGSVLGGRSVYPVFPLDFYNNAYAVFAFGNALISFGGADTDMATFLTSCGANVSGWQLLNIPTQGMSADGLTILGQGKDSSALPENWIARITPRPKSLNFSPNSIVGGRQVDAVFSSSYPVGYGATVSLNCSDINAISKGSYPMPAGSSSLTIPLTVAPVQLSEDVTVTATLGNSTCTGTLHISAPSLTSFTLAPVEITGGQSVLGHFTLDGKAASPGVLISLKSDGPSVAAPASVKIPVGQTYLYQYISTNSVASTTLATVTATLGSVEIPVVIQLNPPSLASFSLTPTVNAQQPVLAHFTLNVKAPSSGTLVTLSSTSSALQTPTSVSVPSGQNYLYLYIPTSKVTADTSVTVTASAGGKTFSSSVKIVAPLLLTAFNLGTDTYYGGDPVLFHFVINKKASSGGFPITLTTTIPGWTLPTQTIPAGQTWFYASIPSPKVATLVNGTVTANGGGASMSAHVLLVPKS